MKLLGLPGRLASTHGQMVELINLVRLGQDEAAVRAYGFWGVEDVADPDVTADAAAVAASGADVVFGKSIGTLVGMLAGQLYGFSPERCVFLGTPIRRLEAKGELGLLASHCRRTSTLFIQQTADPGGGWAELSALVSPWSLCVEVAGDDHLYADTAALAAIIEAWAA